jgi:hypothetical protein
MWLLQGCGPQEQPVLDPYPTALAAYDAGRQALERGEVSGAVQALQQAVEADPRSPELQLWLGRAQAAANDPVSAVASATLALGLRPGWGLALYNRACWRVQVGELALAVDDLEAALATGDVGRLQAAADPDLDPLRAHASFSARVPAKGLPLLLQGAPESVFLGSDWTLTLYAAHPRGKALSVAWQGPGPPGLVLRRVVEEVSTHGEETRRSVAWTWRVGGPFGGTIGPLTAESGVLKGHTEAIEVLFLAPEGTPLPGSGQPELPLATERFSGLEEAVPVRLGERVLVRMAAGDRIAWSPRPAQLARFELREDGQALWVGWEAIAGPSTALTVKRGRRVLFEGTVP